MTESAFAYEETIDCFQFRLTKDGILFVKHYKSHEWTERSWYKDQKTGKAWIPAKRKSFVSLIKQCIREGDYADMKPVRKK